MIQICVLSHYQGHLGNEKRLFLTILGRCSLVCPTMARSTLFERNRRVAGKTDDLHQVFVGILGNTLITSPTLAQEYLELRDLLASRSITLDDWDRHPPAGDASGNTRASFTVLGRFSECELPTEAEEIEGLARHQHLGQISKAATEVLKFGIGQRGAERRATLRRAIASTS